ncbi:MAG: hypothetical protein AB3N18_04550 [Allomuricauda sp.]
MILPKKIHKDEKQIVAEVKKQEKFLGSNRLRKGHTQWEYNTVTKEIKPAELESFVHMDEKGNTHRRKKLLIKKDCRYVGALNKENALKKLKKNGLI